MNRYVAILVAAVLISPAASATEGDRQMDDPQPGSSPLQAGPAPAASMAIERPSNAPSAASLARGLAALAETRRRLETRPPTPIVVHRVRALPLGIDHLARRAAGRANVIATNRHAAHDGRCLTGHHRVNGDR